VLIAWFLGIFGILLAPSKRKVRIGLKFGLNCSSPRGQNPISVGAQRAAPSLASSANRTGPFSSQQCFVSLDGCTFQLVPNSPRAQFFAPVLTFQVRPLLHPERLTGPDFFCILCGLGLNGPLRVELVF
jgi:hypothetical protein